jgi:uncharacterized protein (DUF2147 family)
MVIAVITIAYTLPMEFAMYRFLRFWPLRSAIAVVLIFGLSSANSALAQSAYGIWLRPKTGGHIEAFACGGGIGLKVAKSKKAQLVGRTLMCGAKPTAPGVYAGRIRNVEDGRTYTGKVTVRGRSMLLQGCILGGIICRSETWRRLR